MVSACSLEDDLKTATYPFSGKRYYFAVNSMIILVYHVLLLLFCLIQEIEKSKCGKLWRPDGIVFIARSCFFLICANYFSLILKSFFFHFEEPCLDVTWAQSPSYEALFKNLRRTSGRSGHFHECHDLNMSHDSAMSAWTPTIFPHLTPLQVLLFVFDVYLHTNGVPPGVCLYWWPSWNHYVN